MKTAEQLRKKLQEIDHRGYPAYKDLKGEYDFRDYILSIDHVQGDPFAAPSKLSVHVTAEKAKFPDEYYENYVNRITLQDHLTRLFAEKIEKGSFQAKGSGKSGLLTVSKCGQQVLERTACRVGKEETVVRFEAGFPANGRSINSRELEKMLFRILPECVRTSLYFEKIDQKKLQTAVELCEDQQAIREQLPTLGLCAFIANGSVLPRQNGVSEKPLKGAVLFRSPESLQVTLKLPHKGEVTGMGIRKGITLFVGGGYHGKSTVLQALQDGVYNHIAGDGREYVITDESAVKLRAEDGRSVTNVDISPFIKHLPNRKDTIHFSTEDASGSTSQAAGLMEAIECGSCLLLMDEDTSATNFMIRDRLMQQVVSPAEEPITPFISRVNSLYEAAGISSILVAGSSGSYFSAADTIVQMKEYVPFDITEKAKQAAERLSVFEHEKTKFPSFNKERRPKADMALKREERLKIRTFGKNEVTLAKNTIELRYLEQLKEEEQTEALGYIMKALQLQLVDGKRTVAQLLDLLEDQLDEGGLESLFQKSAACALVARPRRQEIAACLNRYRRLYF